MNFLSLAFSEGYFVLEKIQKRMLTEIDCHVIINEPLNEAAQNIEAWLSLVERYIRDVEVAGSNPVASIFFVQNPKTEMFSDFFFFLKVFVGMYTKRLSCVTMPTDKIRKNGKFR